MTTRVSVRLRLFIAVLLAVVAGILLFLQEQETPVERAEEVREELLDINGVVDAMLVRYGIEKSAVRTWQVQTPDKQFIRVERRVLVPPEFVSVTFNHDLNRELKRLGATGVATERTKENTVTIHIKQDGVIIQSIALVVKRTP